MDYRDCAAIYIKVRTALNENRFSALGSNMPYNRATDEFTLKVTQMCYGEAHKQRALKFIQDNFSDVLELIKETKTTATFKILVAKKGE